MRHKAIAVASPPQSASEAELDAFIKTVPSRMSANQRNDPAWVAQLHTHMFAAGYDCGLHEQDTAEFGKETEAAVAKFQVVGCRLLNLLMHNLHAELQCSLPLIFAVPASVQQQAG